MSYLLWQHDQAAAVGSTRLVFRAAEVPLVADALALCDRLNAEQAAAAERIATAAGAAREAGYAKGYNEGRSEGRERIAATLIALHETVTREREALRASVAGLALEVVRRIAGQLDSVDVITALAATAARDLMPADVLSLLVHASKVEAVRARLTVKAPALHCEIRGDTNVVPDACHLATKHGSIDASLAAQLERIEAAWRLAR